MLLSICKCVRFPFLFNWVAKCLDGSLDNKSEWLGVILIYLQFSAGKYLLVFFEFPDPYSHVRIT